MTWTPSLSQHLVAGQPETITLGHPLVDDYIAFVGARARRNTWLATAYDLKVFFGQVPKEPTRVTPADVFSFIRAQRTPRHGGKVVRLQGGESGPALRTIKRPLPRAPRAFRYLSPPA